MTPQETRQWLDAVWAEVLEAGQADPDAEVDRLVNSGLVSIRYAFVTQLLGKIADPARSLLAFQLGGQEAGAWDARSFCTAVVVPWVADNHGVMGASLDPYVNNPLRVPLLERDAPGRRYQAEWNALYDFLEPLDNAPPEEIKAAFRRCLASVARRLAGQAFRYQIPVRVSLPALCETLGAYLDEPSGGHRPLAVAAAMMRVLGDGFSIFARVEAQGLNEADAAGGAPGDVMCYGADGRMVLAVEVKDRALTLADVRGSTRKAREADIALTNLLFAVPAIGEPEAIAAAQGEWAAGLNVYVVDIVDLAKATFVLMPEESRPTLLRAIGTELDDRGDHAHRRAWHDLLLGLAGEDGA